MVFKRRTFSAVAASAAVLTLALSACGGVGRTDTGSSAGGTSSGSKITIGTTDKVVTIDPAGSYDNGSLMLQTQLYQYLMIVPAGGTTPTGDAAEKCEFTDNGASYTCTMKPGLKFSNGDPLTAKDAAFSFERVVKINDPNGPSSLLANMESVSAPDDNTVVFKLKAPNDQTFPFVLGTVAGPIVDSKVFPADKVLDDAKVIGSGPYKLDGGTYSKNSVANLLPNTNYAGNGGKVANSGVILKYYQNSTNLAQDVKSGAVDVAWRSLDAQTLNSLKTDSKVQVHEGPGGEVRYVVFNLDTMPGGTPEQKLAVRRAVAQSVDRDQISKDVYQGNYTPAYSMVASSLPGYTPAFETAYGKTPNKEAAAKALSDAGVQTPVELNLQYNPDHYGPGSADEYGAVKRQLEATGLFKVNLQSTEWTTYNNERKKDAYPAYQLGWFPDFSDADNYLSPFLVEDNFVGAHYCDPGKTNRPCDTDGMLSLLTAEQTTSGDARLAALKQIQDKLATETLPYLPLLEGKQFAVSGKDVKGVDSTLDPSFLFRFWLISK